MLKNFTVPIPVLKGKIYKRKARLRDGSSVTYIEFEKSRTYSRERKNTSTKRTTIGRTDPENEGMMFPNDNYYRYIDDPVYPDQTFTSERSGCLKTGAFLVIEKIIKDYKLDEFISQSVGKRYAGLFLDLAAYGINCEDNASQYYPDYAYSHPLFTDRMHIYSDSTISRFLKELSVDSRLRFMELWTGRQGKQDKIYVSYDSTNKISQAGDIEIVEPGESKQGSQARIFNYSLVYDHDNREPVLYEKYPGSINDVSQLESLLKKIEGYGYGNICMILDRGYFSRDNIRYMDEHGIDFIMMVKGQKPLVNGIILEHKGEFEDKIMNHIGRFDVNGMTVQKRLYESDEKERHFHLYYSPVKYAKQRSQLMGELSKMEAALKKGIGTSAVYSDRYHRYYELYYREQVKETTEGGVTSRIAENILHAFAPRTEVIDTEASLCGYFSIVTTEQMSAAEALIRYKGRDPEEKLFRGDKSYLGNSSMRVYSDESMESKIFIEFVALIIRNRIYLTLLDEMNRMEKKMNFMTVPAAIKELNKIELIRLPDGVYRLDHAITATQKTILKAFGITAGTAKQMAEKIGKDVAKYQAESADKES